MCYPPRKMAAFSLIVLLSTFTLGHVCATTGVFDHIFDGVDSCHDTCDNTYAAHTYENGNEADSCKRGCRFHSIMALIHNHADNETMADCISSCHEAYTNSSHNSSDVDACMVGCHSQPVAPPSQDTDSDQAEAEAMAHMLYPLMYMHSMYSNMLDHVYQRMEYSWSVFRQGDQVLLVRSQPVVITFVSAQDSDTEGEIHEDTPWPDDRTSSQVETNIAGQDNSATPFFSFAFGPSQLRSSRSMASPRDIQLDVQGGQGRSDWLSCVARKTGIARIILCFLILATAVVMIWFCLSAAATAPEQHLSINGDLEYLRSGQDKGAYLRLLNPQSRVEARPLPVKIRVEQI